MTKNHRFVVLGTGGNFTFTVLQALIKQNFLPLAFIQSGDAPQSVKASFANIELDIKKTTNALFQLLVFKNIPHYFQSQIEIPELIQQLNAEFLLVACWPELLAEEILKSASNAALNLHPSLLPKFRGVNPVADQLLTKDTNFGISLHLLNEKFDTGDIVLQESLEIQNNPNKTTIEKKAAQKGAELYMRAVNTFQHPGWSLIKQTA